ncbi:MAG TPA: 3-deoxy-7-phosphoheptulonate synthase [Thioploca sp.]|nr:3-deoxy-7-phosphoheptulonate synthase [Thioploca sp.]
MIIIMRSHVTDEEINAVKNKLKELDLEANISRGVERTIIGAIGEERSVHEESLQALSGVEDVIRVVKPYKIVAREWHKEDTIIDIKGMPLGGKKFQVIAGPCSVETQEQMDLAAKKVAAAGCNFMRAGAFKPRTSPYSFQGKGVEGLKMFRQAADKYNLPIITELMDVRYLDDFLKYKVDIIQIGTRNMQNFDLLKEVGKIHTPVILKRGLCATLSEWLMSAEYIAAGGNHNIILCERGVRTFEKAYRNMLDVTAIPVLKKETHLPVIVDPSHAGGKAELVPALSKAAIAAGADGLLIEMHPNPCEAWCDADQALAPDKLVNLMADMKGIVEVIGREF